MHWDPNKIFQLLPFYGSYIEKLKVKKLNNVQLLRELPFRDELIIVKNILAFMVMPDVIKLKFLS